MPIVFYDGPGDWTAATNLHEKVLLSYVLGEFIPDYRCILIQLNGYSNAELMKREDVLSVVVMMNLHQALDFARAVSEVSPEYLQKVLTRASEYLVNIIAQVTEALLSEINVLDQEIDKFLEQIKERRMGKTIKSIWYE